jgi:hypothetical protein
VTIANRLAAFVWFLSVTRVSLVIRPTSKMSLSFRLSEVVGRVGLEPTTGGL